MYSQSVITRIEAERIIESLEALPIEEVRLGGALRAWLVCGKPCSFEPEYLSQRLRLAVPNGRLSMMRSLN